MKRGKKKEKTSLFLITRRRRKIKRMYISKGRKKNPPKNRKETAKGRGEGNGKRRESHQP